MGIPGSCHSIFLCFLLKEKMPNPFGSVLWQLYFGYMVGFFFFEGENVDNIEEL